MRSSIIGRHFCVKCNERRDHVRLGRRIESSKTPDTTFIWAEFWACDHCGNHLEKREERPWPADRDMITKRLLKVATDYEQVKASHLQVEHARIVLTLELHPWHSLRGEKTREQEPVPSLSS